MRRVYYVYTLRLVFHRLTLSAAVFVLSLYALGKLVFVARVVEGFLDTPIRELLPRAIRVLVNADVLTLVVFGVCVVAVLSISVNIMTSMTGRVPRTQMA